MASSAHESIGGLTQGLGVTLWDVGACVKSHRESPTATSCLGTAARLSCCPLVGLGRPAACRGTGLAGSSSRRAPA